MAVTDDILRTYRAPRAQMRRMLDAGQRDDRALAVLIGACVLIFVAQWPRLAREAYLDEAIPFEARLTGALFAWLFLAPILAYGVAALSHLVARAAGGRGSFFSARLALFWTLLATAPLFLLSGLVAGFIGAGTAAAAVGILTAGAFLVIWIACLAEAEFPGAVASGSGSH